MEENIYKKMRNRQIRLDENGHGREGGDNGKGNYGGQEKEHIKKNASLCSKVCTLKISLISSSNIHFICQLLHQ